MKKAGVVQQGSLRGKRITAPVAVSGKQFSTPQKVKEAAFQIFSNLLDFSSPVIFGDLYAGSGQMGVEAVSRGMVRCFFSEIHAGRLRDIRNLATGLGIFPSCSFYQLDGIKTMKKLLQKTPAAVNALKNPQLALFADPPYSFHGVYRSLVRELDEGFAASPFSRVLLLIQTPEKHGDPWLNRGNPAQPPDKVYHYGKHLLLSYLRTAGS